MQKVVFMCSIKKHKKVSMYLHITMIMAANYGDAVLLKSAVMVTYFMCGNKKRTVPCHQPALSFE